jgi:sugar transferase (PEP-CTERM system associated)
MITSALGHTFRTDTLVRVAFDFGFVFVGILIAAMWIGSGIPVHYGLVAAYAGILAVTMLALNAWLGFYQRIHNRSIRDSYARAVLALHLSIPVAYLIFSILPDVEGNRTMLELSGMAAVFGILSYHVFSSHRRSRVEVSLRILVFGTGKLAAASAISLCKEDSTVEIVGFYPGPESVDVEVPEDKVISRATSLVEVANELKVDEVVVALGEHQGERVPLRELLDCRQAGILVLDVSSHFERMLGQIRLEVLPDSWLEFVSEFRQGTARATIKRIFDIVVAATLLVLFAPLMLMTALLVAIEDGFPVFYSQQRVGLYGRLFNVIKFRSMRRDAEKDGKPRWAARNDDRVTRVGKIIRKLRIDELPQLLLVLKGDMSVVGPRPERPYFVDQLTKEIPFYAVRHSVKPGVTGWAQVRYQYGETVEDTLHKLQYDLYYVKNNSLLLDLVVTFETVSVVVSGKGAH